MRIRTSVVALALAASPAQAASLLVDAAGGEGRYASVQAALGDAESGDTVYIFDGVYEEAGTVTCPDGSFSWTSLLPLSVDVNVIGESPDGVVLRWPPGISGVEVLGVHFVAGLDTGAETRIVRNLTLDVGPSTPAATVGGPEQAGIFTDGCGYEGVAGRYELANVVFLSHPSAGNYASWWNTSTFELDVRNATFLFHPGSGRGAAHWGNRSAPGSEWRSLVFRDLVDLGRAEGGAMFAFSHSLVGGEAAPGWPSSVDAAPVFVDADAGDFRLAPGSVGADIGDVSDCPGASPEPGAFGGGDACFDPAFRFPTDTDGDGWDVDGRFLGEADCDDDDPAVSPSAVEVCNGADDDCDGDLDEGFDEDGDGVTTCGGDCDDTDPALIVATPEHEDTPGSCDDGVDNDCDGEVDVDIECMSVGCDGCVVTGAPATPGILLVLPLLGRRRR